MKKNNKIKQAIMIMIIAFLSVKSQSTHVNAQEKSKTDAKQTIEQQLFGKDAKETVNVSKYHLKRSQAKQIITRLEKDYHVTGLIKCTYQTDEDGTVNRIKVQTDESLRSVIEEVNDQWDDNTDDSEDQMKKQVIADYAQLQQFYEANPDYFGVPVPFFTDKDTDETPLGAIIELADLDEDNLDLEELDQTICGIKQALEMYIQYYGEEFLKIRDEILAQTDDKMSEIEKLLVVHDELARRTAFDTDYLEKTGTGGGGLLSSTGFGALNAKKAICLGYAATYGYFVQYMHPEIYKNEDGSWKTKEEVGDNYIIDYAKYINGNPHYMNVIKLEDKWYYLDPSFDDIKFDQVVGLRSQMDGSCSHQFFLYTQENMEKWINIKSSVIDSSYKDKCVNTNYSDEWYSNVTSEISHDDTSWYYVLPQVNTVHKDGNFTRYTYVDKKDQLKIRDRESGEVRTLVDYESGNVYQPDGTFVEENEELKEEYQIDTLYNKIYPGMQHSVSLYQGALYFNVGNKIYKYSLSDASVTKIKEYNQLYVKKDESVSPIREGFFLTDENGDNTHLNFTERPIASLSIKDDGKMYVSLATNLSGAYSYEQEAVNYIPYYGYLGENTSYSKQFKKCANIKETLDMEHLEGEEHEYETVSVAPTCLRKGFTEERCKICGRVKEGTRKETSDIVDHHYVYDASAKKYRCTYCNQVTSSAIEHQYDQKPIFHWSEDKESCEAEFVCSVCGNKETVACEVTSEVIKKSNCVEEGIEEYIAECAFRGEIYTDTRAKMLPRLAKKVTLQNNKMTVYATEGKKVELNSNYPKDDVASMKASKSGIVRFSGNRIYGVKSGSVTVTIYTKSKITLKCNVTVKKPPITLSKKTMSLFLKQTYKLAVSKKISSDKVSKWKSSKTKVATVDKNGKVTAKAKGTCYITVTMKSGASAKVKVTVKKKIPIKTLKTSKKTITLTGSGDTYQIKVTKTPRTANETITYKTSNSQIATVTSQGKITAKNPGICVITIKGGKKILEVKVIVKMKQEELKKKR